MIYINNEKPKNSVGNHMLYLCTYIVKFFLLYIFKRKKIKAFTKYIPLIPLVRKNLQYYF